MQNYHVTCLYGNLILGKLSTDLPSKVLFMFLAILSLASLAYAFYKEYYAKN